MKKIKILLLMIYGMLASCTLIDFSEDCTFYGDVEVRPDWSGLLKGDTKPELTDIYFLSPQVNYQHRVLTDTLIKDVQATAYKVLAFNSSNLTGIRFVAMDCPETAKAELETYRQDGKLYTIQAPAFYASNTNLSVIPYEMVTCAPVLQSSIRQVNIDFVVIDNTNIGTKSINGELSGIAYQYGFRELEQVESSAWLAFGTERNTEKNNLFSTQLKVFGINPNKQGVNRISNLLEINLQTSDGRQFLNAVDLTSVFNGFMTRLIHITIEVRLTHLGVEVGITGWNISDGGSIEL